MKEFRKLLCVVDERNPRSQALQRAAWFAKASGAELELLAVHYNDYMLGHPLYDKSRLEASRTRAVANVKQDLGELARELADEHGITVSATAVWDHPEHAGVVRHAVASGADIVFKDAEHHSALQLAILSNEDWQLIRRCPMPLWIAKRELLPDEHRFVAAVDPFHKHDKPAQLDDAILELGSRIAATVKGEVHAFHAFDPRIASSAAENNAYIPVSLPLSDIEEEMREQHAERFRAVVEPHGIPGERVHLVTGMADEELPRIAEKLAATAVIMGAVARNAVKQLFIGSTAERALNRLDADLVVVKPD